MTVLRLARALAVPALVSILSFSTADVLSAQLGGLKKAAGKLADKTPDVSSLLHGKPPITTGLADATFAIDSLDAYGPEEFVAMTSLERTPNRGFVLEPGYYWMQSQSYCLKAGTHAPGGGDGYLYAPPAGPAQEAVVSIVRNSADNPSIPQHDIQVLLWAIIARAKFEDLETSLKATASQLLTAQQLAVLNRGALDLLPGPALDKAVAEAPPVLRQVLEAEAALREMLTSGTSSYSDLERVAVLTGVAPRGEGSKDVPSGRWSGHPDGYYVRYIPSGYTSTRIEIWVPEGSQAVGKEFDPSMHIAVPGNTARQRLIQSGRVHDEA